MEYRKMAQCTLFDTCTNLWFGYLELCGCLVRIVHKRQTQKFAALLTDAVTSKIVQWRCAKGSRIKNATVHDCIRLKQNLEPGLKVEMEIISHRLDQEQPPHVV
jgi:hypothetical protein